VVLVVNAAHVAHFGIFTSSGLIRVAFFTRPAAPFTPVAFGATNQFLLVRTVGALFAKVLMISPSFCKAFAFTNLKFALVVPAVFGLHALIGMTARFLRVTLLHFTRTARGRAARTARRRAAGFVTGTGRRSEAGLIARTSRWNRTGLIRWTCVRPHALVFVVLIKPGKFHVAIPIEFFWVCWVKRNLPEEVIIGRIVGWALLELDDRDGIADVPA